MTSYRRSRVGATAKDKDDCIVYDKAKGALSYDAGGSAKGAAVKFAHLAKNIALTSDHFYTISTELNETAEGA
jgi:hypothetical protein